MPLEAKPSGKAPGHGSRQQHMAGLFHDQPCCGNGVKEAFEGSDGAGAKPCPFHDRGVHALNPVQLPFRAAACIEEPGGFKHADRSFDGDKRRSVVPKYGMAGDQRLGQT